MTPRHSWAERREALRDVWAVSLLFIFIIGGIYAGVFTATEAAGMGAAGAFIIAVLRQKLSRADFLRCLVEILAHHRVGLHHPDRRADFRLFPHHHADAAKDHRTS